MTKRVITSFTSLTTAEGKNLTFTYSEINEDGQKIKENERQTIIVMDENIEKEIENIQSYLLKKIK